MHNLTKVKYFRLALWVTYPFALLFILPLSILRKKNSSNLFFFFDRYSIGGAQRVHLDILESVRDIPKQVFFTRLSVDKKLKKQFYEFPLTKSFDIHFWCDNIFFRLFSVHYFAFYLNRHKGATVFSSNSTYFYDLLPFLKSHLNRLELLHNFTYGSRGMEFFGLASYKWIDRRFVIDAHTLNLIRAQYQQYNIPAQYSERVELIEFGVPLPETINKVLDGTLRILNAGRGGEQKRIWLVNRIAEYFIGSGKKVEFHFAGPMIAELSAKVRAGSFCYGELSDRSKLNELYERSHGLILTSAFEGFPMVIKEAMAYGVIPIVTALPGNKTHLKNDENALLIEAIENEDAVVKEAIEQIDRLITNPKLVETLSQNVFQYARRHFGRDKFLNRYREVLLHRKTRLT